jgi:hypothetical protein
MGRWDEWVRLWEGWVVGGEEVTPEQHTSPPTLEPPTHTTRTPMNSAPTGMF